MVKGWADHSSSEEEDEEEEFLPVDPGTGVSEPPHEPQIHWDGEHEANFAEHVPVVYEYPAEPPYTAFVGNLAYSITDGPMFADAMAQLVLEQLQVHMTFKNGKMVTDPASNHTRHRGFGYIEVETIEDLKKLMELNECHHPLIAGRRINVDTIKSRQRGGGNNNKSYKHNNSDRRRPSDTSNASSSHNNNNNSSRRNSSRSTTSIHSDVASEGSKFRGGRHQNNSNNTNSYGSIAIPNQSVSSAATSNDAPLSASSSQRRVLVLKPRSKPVDGERPLDTVGNDATSSDLSGSISSIFGAAKPRDEQSWLSQKQTTSATARSSETTDVSHANTHDNQASAPSSSQSSSQHQPDRDFKPAGRGSGAGRTGARTGRGGMDGNNRGSGRAYSGRGGSNNTTARERDKYSKNHGSDGAPATTTVGRKDRKKSTGTTAPASVAPPSKPIEPEKKPPAKPTNVFSALALDDSDSD